MKKATIGLQQPIIADGQATEVTQPANCALDDPPAPVPTQSAAVLMRGLPVIGPSLNNRLNPTSDEQSTGGIAVIGTVSNQPVRPLAGAPWLVRASHHAWSVRLWRPLFRGGETSVDETLVPTQFLGVIELRQEGPPQSK